MIMSIHYWLLIIFMQFLAGDIVEFSPYAVNVLERQLSGVRTIGQEDKYSVIFGVDPKRRTRKSVVSKALRRQRCPCGRIFRRGKLKTE